MTLKPEEMDAAADGRPSGEAITVVVPVKDRHSLVVHTLESIKAQTWRPLKVIVVDNASKDHTPVSVAKWIADNRDEPGFSVRLLEESFPGPSAARNRGLEEVDTRYMMHFDSDDIMRPDHIAKIMERFAGEDLPDLITFRLYNHFTDGKVKVTHAVKRELMETHLIHASLCSAGYACETALVRRAGSWDESLHCWEDLELGVRLVLESRHRVWIPDINVDVYSREESVTGMDFTSKMGLWEKALDRMEESLEKSRHRKREKWIRFVAYRRAILAAAYAREGNHEAGRSLLAETLAHPLLSPLHKLYLKASYQFASRGGRGSAIVAPFIL